ncbi:MAG TPA: DUF5916 domain-containing protein [Chryseosolibacter sp.]|nr:DUF5916 domain-containing protein [Chryseosolibacter sp.]
MLRSPNPIVAILLVSATVTYSQAQQTANITIQRTNEKIQVDGILNEAAWADAPKATRLLNKWPVDTGYAVQQTDVRVLFDTEFIFISAVNFQKKEDLVIQTLRRDQLNPFFSSDGFSVLLDPMNQRTNGFLFGVNAAGAQVEGAVNLVGAWSRTNENWDNKWFSAVTVYEDRWVAELAIPFTALRFKEGALEWGVNFIRNDMKTNAYSTWSFVPLQFNGTDLGHLGTLRWPEKISPKRSRATVIPYITGATTKDFAEGTGTQTTGNAGVDMKLSLSSSLNLDVTYRPDFSNVEVDRQMMNITRFSLMFPERRNFFLENADLFTNFGSWLTRPFFSRKIGLHDGEPVPIVAGARLSGNVTKGLRIGVMDMQTAATTDLSANNYLIAAAQQRVFDRSNIRVFAANRQTTKAIEGDLAHDFNRTFGGELQYLSTDGKWTAFMRGHTAETPEKTNDNHYLSGQVNYIHPKFYTGLLTERVAENYINDLGFIPRLNNYDPVMDSTYRIGHYSVNPWLGLLIFPKKSRLINMIEPNTWSIINYRTGGRFLERNTSVNVLVLFKNTSQLLAEVFNTEVHLPYAVDLIGNDYLVPVGEYAFTHHSVKYTSDSRKALSGDITAGYGTFYTGTRVQFGGTVNFRAQPWGAFSISMLQNNIDLGPEYGSASFQLICPSADVSLRNNLWWSTFLQYNTQADNFNINSRIQWRYKPMSDFFIVYSDNYASADLKAKNRGIVFKLTYWLNL